MKKTIALKFATAIFLVMIFIACKKENNLAPVRGKTLSLANIGNTEGYTGSSTLGDSTRKFKNYTGTTGTSDSTRSK